MIATCPMDGKLAKIGKTNLVKPVVANYANKERKWHTSSSKVGVTKKIHSKEEDDAMIKIKKRNCYTCWTKGHLSKDCPNGNIANPKLVKSNSNLNELGKAYIGPCASKVISSPSVSKRVIWVPKSILTNLGGPNMAWVPKYT